MSMAPPYRARMADSHLADLLADFPAVMITGARAAGKTTTAAKHVARTVRLDEPGVAATYRADPDAALRRSDRPVLLDEWQEVPEVLAAVKRAVDLDPTPGQFVLTGSVRAELAKETWAGTGRVVRMSMYPVVERERRDVLDPGRPSFLSRLATSGTEELHRAVQRAGDRRLRRHGAKRRVPRSSPIASAANGHAPPGWQATSTTSSPGMPPPLTAPRTPSSCAGT